MNILKNALVIVQSRIFTTKRKDMSMMIMTISQKRVGRRALYIYLVQACLIVLYESIRVRACNSKSDLPKGRRTG